MSATTSQRAVVRDTCNVYVLRNGREAVADRLRQRRVLDQLDELGVDRVTDVLVTHHHRDQVQGLARAAAAGIRIWVPPVEEELFADVEQRWRSRQLDNDYDLRQDRFSLLENVPSPARWTSTARARYGGVEVFTLPTPGHTVGSVTYLVEDDGRRLAFTGDLLYGPGQVWSLAATQWTYSGGEGQTVTLLSCGVAADREPDLLLPSHGEPIDDPPAARRAPARAPRGAPRPAARAAVGPRALAARSRGCRSRRTCCATARASRQLRAALRLGRGAALRLGLRPRHRASPGRPSVGAAAAARVDRRAAPRPRRRADRGGRADALPRRPRRRDQPPARRGGHGALGAGELRGRARAAAPVTTCRACGSTRFRSTARSRSAQPFTLAGVRADVHPLPGHTLYAAAIAFEVDGRRVLATGDQQASGGPTGPILNYQYRNRFRIDDFVASAELYRELQPDVIVSGHWLPREVTRAYLDRLLADGARLAELHRELLPLDEVDFGAEGFGARIEPYRSERAPGGAVALDRLGAEPVRRGGDAERAARASRRAGPRRSRRRLGCRRAATRRCPLRGRRGLAPVAARAGRRRRSTVDGRPFGQQAEALVDVDPDEQPRRRVRRVPARARAGRPSRGSRRRTASSSPRSGRSRRSTRSTGSTRRSRSSAARGGGDGSSSSAARRSWGARRVSARSSAARTLSSCARRVEGRGELTDVHLLGCRSLVRGSPLGLMPSGSRFRSLFSPNPGDPRRSAVRRRAGRDRRRRRRRARPGTLALHAGAALLALDRGRASRAGRRLARLGLAAPVDELSVRAARLRAAPTAASTSARLRGAHARRRRVRRAGARPHAGRRRLLRRAARGTATTSPPAAPRRRRHRARRRPGGRSRSSAAGAPSAASRRGHGDRRRRSRRRPTTTRSSTSSRRTASCPGRSCSTTSGRPPTAPTSPTGRSGPTSAAGSPSGTRAASASCSGGRRGIRRASSPELCIRNPDGDADRRRPEQPGGARAAARDVAAHALAGRPRRRRPQDRLHRADAERPRARDARRRLGHRAPARAARRRLRRGEGGEADALVITHTPHPAFVDVTDMIRLNDMVGGRRAPSCRRCATAREVALRGVPGAARSTPTTGASRASPSGASTSRRSPSSACPSLYYVRTVDATGEAFEPRRLRGAAAHLGRWEARTP